MPTLKRKPQNDEKRESIIASLKTAYTRNTMFLIRSLYYGGIIKNIACKGKDIEQKLDNMFPKYLQKFIDTHELSPKDKFFEPCNINDRLETKEEYKSKTTKEFLVFCHQQLYPLIKIRKKGVQKSIEEYNVKLSTDIKHIKPDLKLAINEEEEDWIIDKTKQYKSEWLRKELIRYENRLLEVLDWSPSSFEPISLSSRTLYDDVDILASCYSYVRNNISKDGSTCLHNMRYEDLIYDLLAGAYALLVEHTRSVILATITPLPITEDFQVGKACIEVLERLNWESKYKSFIIPRERRLSQNLFDKPEIVTDEVMRTKLVQDSMPDFLENHKFSGQSVAEMIENHVKTILEDYMKQEIQTSVTL